MLDESRDGARRRPARDGRCAGADRPAPARSCAPLGLVATRDVEQALDAALEDVDVATLLDRALEKRLRARDAATSRDPATVREVVGALVRQGFAPGAVLARLRAMRCAR